MCAEFARQLLLVLAPPDRHGLKTHAARELHAEMAETADALHRHDVASARTRIAQRVEGGDAGAQQRRGVDGIELIGDRCERLDRRDHVVGIAAVEVNAGNPEVAAGDEIAPPAAGTRPATPPNQPTPTLWPARQLVTSDPTASMRPATS